MDDLKSKIPLELWLTVLLCLFQLGLPALGIDKQFFWAAPLWICIISLGIHLLWSWASSRNWPPLIKATLVAVPSFILIFLVYERLKVKFVEERIWQLVLPYIPNPDDRLVWFVLGVAITLLSIGGLRFLDKSQDPEALTPAPSSDATLEAATTAPTPGTTAHSLEEMRALRKCGRRWQQRMPKPTRDRK
jgi:hypothetical protein